MTAPRTPDETAMRLADLLGDHGLHLGDRPLHDAAAAGWSWIADPRRRSRSHGGRTASRHVASVMSTTARLAMLRRGRPTGADGMIEFDCEGCGGHVVATGRDTIPRSGLCATCEWLCEFVPDPEGGGSAQASRQSTGPTA